MHKQTHPNSNHPYRVTNTGSEGGGYPLQRITPGGPGQGAQDPKSQPPQQSIPSGSMSMGYTPNPRGGQNYYASRPHPPQRMGNGGGPRMSNIQHLNPSMPATTAVYAATISPSSMMQQQASFIPGQGCGMLLPQMSYVSARHPGQASGNQQQNYFPTIPYGYGSSGQPIGGPYSGYPAVLFSAQSMRGHVYNPQNSAPNTVIQQQTAPQQTPTVYMDPVGGGGPQVSMTQLGTGPGSLNGAQHMMGPQAPTSMPIVSTQVPPQGQMMPGQPPKDSKSRRKFAIPIINPTTLQEIAMGNESKIVEDGGSNSTEDSSSSHLPSSTAADDSSAIKAQQVVGEFALKIAAVACAKNSGAPTVASSGATPNLLTSSAVHEDERTNGPLDTPQENDRVVEPSSIPPTPNSQSQQHLPQNQLNPPQSQPFHPPPPAATLIPTVSANSNSPTIELHRPSPPSMSSVVKQPLSASSGLPPPTPIQHTVPHPQSTAASTPTVHQVVNPAPAVTPTVPSPSVSPAQSTSPLPQAHPQQQQAAPQITQPSPPSQAVASVRKPQMAGPPSESAVAAPKNVDRKKEPATPCPAITAEKSSSVSTATISNKGVQQPSGQPNAVPVSTPATQAPALPVSQPPVVKPKSTFSEQISFSNIPPLITSAVKKASPPAAAPAPASAPAPANVDKGANGEAEAPVGKVLQRPKKKPNQIRKGVDKSGSVMDAFYDSSDNTTTTAPATASPAVTPAAPAAATRPPPAARDPSPLPPPKEATPPPPAAPAPVSAASVEPSPPQTNVSVKNSKSPVQEVVFLQKDEIENEEISTVTENEDYPTGNDIDAMVAAKNEENTKVTEAANNNNNNNITNAVTPEIVKDDEEANKENEGSTEPEENEVEPQSIKSMTIERSSAQPTLKHKYKENQWSPINRDGKKVYDREFLLQIKTSELALKKPEFSIDMEIFRDKPNDAPINNRQRSLYGSSSMSSRGDSMGGLSYQRSSNSSSNQRSGGSSKNSDRRDRGPSSRPMGNSQSGNRSMGSKPFSSYGHLTRDDPQLHKDPHGGWKRQKLLDTSEMTDEDKQIDALKRSVRGILNKLTPEKFEKLLGQIMELPIDTKQHMEEMVNLVFEKAVDEPSFSKAYADLCKCLQKKSVQIEAESIEGKSEQVPLNFRKLLLNKCQWAFEKIKLDGDDIEKRMKEIEETTDVEKKKELKLLLEDAERRIRRKSVGLVRFIGELYKLQMLTPKIMQGCITTLLDRVGEEPLECLCKLMTTIGKELEKELSPKDFNNYFIQMGKLARKSANSEVSSRIRFMLQDVIELRERDWKPRRDENNPKTLDQIEKDAIRAEMESAAMSAPISSNQRKHPSDDRNRGRPSRPQENDGWQTTVSKYRSSGSSYAVTPDASKLQNLKSQADLSGILLGGHNAFSQWGGGASSKRLGSESSRSMASNSFSNQFSALSQDDRIKPLSTSSSSMGSKVMRDRDKEDSFGRLGSKPSSRESSRSRFGQSGPSPAVSLNSRNERSELPSSRNYQMDNRDSNKSRMPPLEAPELSEEEAERKAQTVYCEWCANNNIKETLAAVHESFVGPKNICLMLRSLLNKMIDGKRPARLKFAELLVVLLKENVCSSKDLVVEFVSLVEFADDMIVDIPLFWSFLGEIFAPIIAGEVFTFDDAKASLEGRSLDDKSKVLLEVFKLLLATDKTDIWAMSNAQLQDFVPEDKVESYINNNQLLFLFPNYTAPVFIMKHRDHLVNILKSDKDDAFDEACAFLNKIENSVTKKAFIEIVSMAVIKASIKDGKLVVQLLTKHEKLLHKFVDHEEELELYCLFAIKNYLVNEVTLEMNVLVESFENLYDHSVISVEAFKKWKSDESVEPLVAKGRLLALKALDPFYVTLAEPDDDEDEDES